MANDPNWNLRDVPAFTLESRAVAPGAALPQWARATGAGGEDRSPALTWSGAPEGTRSFVLTVLDPDAPTSSGWWHWAAARSRPAPVLLHGDRAVFGHAIGRAQFFATSETNE